MDVARYGASVGDLPPLALPFELSQRVLSRLVDRAWLDYVSLGRLSGCVLAAIELSDCAHLQDEWIELIMVHHGRTLARVDLSGCPNLSDAGVAHLSTCKKLRELNLSRCTTHRQGARRARGLPLEQLRLEQLNLSAAALATHLAPLAPTLRWLSRPVSLPPATPPPPPHAPAARCSSSACASATRSTTRRPSCAPFPTSSACR